ncbi:undecaprenyl/decaprenyl-phosphate alpha-N-acetylglucosaminyl 1-phosphate transferase [bacterium]|nr:undecaprenyl/decaprenyl-phosphate alpha-N-acetylglucosaminyl 1-phosphate transferase [bacterium]
MLQKLKPIFLILTVLWVVISLVPEVRIFFENEKISWLYILANAFGISAILVPLVRFLALKYNVVDKPDARKVHLEATPLLGGLAIFIAFIASLYINQFFSEKLKAVIFAGTLIVLVSAFDDIFKLSSTIRLLTQLLASFVLIYFGIKIQLFGGFGVVGQVSDILITLVWLIGITNAFNFFDGLDGLATGLGIIAVSFFGFVGIRSGQTFLSFISVALAGACLGFLPYNFKPKMNATIFLGDTGSTFIGFMLASLAIMGEWSKNEPIKSLTIPLLILSIVIFDMIYITIARFYSGKVKTIKQWLDYVGKDHLHHRLIDLGLSKKQSVIFIYFVTVLLGLQAMVLKKGELIDTLISLVEAVLIFLLIAILMIIGASKKK